MAFSIVLFVFIPLIVYVSIIDSQIKRQKGQNTPAPNQDDDAYYSSAGFDYSPTIDSTDNSYQGYETDSNDDTNDNSHHHYDNGSSHNSHDSYDNSSHHSSYDSYDSGSSHSSHE
jgi:hypothetical protein